MAYEWDPAKDAVNIDKHGVSLADAPAVLEDSHAITITDHESDPTEERFVTMGLDAVGRVLVIVYTHRGDNIRIISARKAKPHERKQYEAEP